MSEIISKFYTTSEKLGMKRHKVSKEESDFLGSVSRFEQFSIFEREDRFNTRRVKIKFIASRTAAIISAVAGLSIVAIY